jgi:hypothetical protein
MQKKKKKPMQKHDKYEMDGQEQGAKHQDT